MSSLTYRQVSCLWERYWERKVWDIEANVKTNPMASFKDDKKADDDDTIDATTDDGMARVQSLGLPVKALKV